MKVDSTLEEYTRNCSDAVKVVARRFHKLGEGVPRNPLALDIYDQVFEGPLAIIHAFVGESKFVNSEYLNVKFVKDIGIDQRLINNFVHDLVDAINETVIPIAASTDSATEQAEVSDKMVGAYILGTGRELKYPV